MQNPGESTRNTLARVLKVGSALVVGTLIVSACGSGGDDPADGGGDPADGPSEALTNWVTEAEAICVSYDTQAVAVVLPQPSEDQAAYVVEVTAAVDELEAFLKAQREEVGALDVPERDGDAVLAMLDLLDEQIELGAELRPFLDDGDVDGMMTQLQDNMSTFLPGFNNAAETLGVPACGSAFE